MTLFIGVAGYFAQRLCNDSSRAEQIAGLLLDPRWPWPPTSVSFGIRAKWGKRTRRQRLTGNKGRDVLRDGIISPEHRDLSVDHRAEVEDNHAHILLETGQRLAAPDWPNPATITGFTKADEMPDGADPLAWVALMHEVMATLEVAHAVLSCCPTLNHVYSDTTFVRIILDTPKGEYLLGGRGELERQRARANHWRPQLGDEFIRHPRWGTYLRRAHLDRVGGLDRIRDAVELAKIIELGDLVFLQCTEHPADALTPEGERVRRALEDVLAPIIVPAWPGEQPVAAKP